MVRIITGTAKGKQLIVPLKARPMSDRAKTSLFSVLGSDIQGKRVLDLYAGSGSLGIEALSRGAKHCTFVENSRHAVTDIKSNLEKTSLTDKALVTKQSALPFLGSQSADEFDIVFADPPFIFYKDNPGRAEMILEAIAEIIPEGGAIILKYPKKLHISEIKGLIHGDSRIFASNAVSLWVKKESK